jgi:membrane protease YdiL (CAAX protease family)
MNARSLRHSNESGSPASRVATVWAVFLLIGLQLPIPSILISGSSLRILLGQEAVYWLMTLTVIAFVLRFERRPLESIGLHYPTWRSLAWGLAGAAAAVIGIAITYSVLIPALGLPNDDAQTQSILTLPAWFRCLLITRAAFFEEIVYRGFAIERLTELTHVRWVAAGISLAAFTYAHLNHWGWPHLLVAGLGGLVLTVLYVWRCDLAANMLAHFMTDAVGFLLG